MPLDASSPINRSSWRQTWMCTNRSEVLQHALHFTHLSKKLLTSIPDEKKSAGKNKAFGGYTL
jgi:hypothetical protein